LERWTHVRPCHDKGTVLRTTPDIVVRFSAGSVQLFSTTTSTVCIFVGIVVTAEKP